MQLGLGLSLVQATPAAAAAPAGYFTHALSTGDSALLVCSQTVSPVIYYSADETLTLGSLLFTNSSLTTPVADAHYSADGIQYFRSIDGEIVDDPLLTLCNDILVPEILLNYGAGIADTCALGPGETTYYIDEGDSQLHLDPYGLTFAPDGNYSDGTVYYTVAGGGGGYTGPTGCPPPEE